MRRTLVAGCMVLCLLGSAGCGYFLYPERRGQIGGEVDVPILILDCTLLVLWIVPGVAALAVDFTSGAIYLPSGEAWRRCFPGMESRVDGGWLRLQGQIRAGPG